MLTGKLALVQAAERVKIGEHLCIVYDRRDDQLATVQPFIRSGLARGEQCLYIVDDNTAETLLAAMRQASIDVDAAVSTRALVIADRRDAYLRGGVFDPDAMLQFWTNALAAAKASGFSALRIIGEMTWALGGEPGVERLLEYEARVNSFISQSDMVALCHYNRQRFAPAIIRGILQTHPQVIFGGLVCSNPYYVPPEAFLHPDEHADITRLLRTLVARERAEEQLRAAREELQHLTRRLVAVQEAERREVARELHDEVGQLLTVLTLLLGRSAQAVPDPPKQWLREAESLVTDLMDRVRELSLRLRPSMLDDLGLMPALRWHVDRYHRQTGVHVSLDIAGMEDRRFAAEVETAAYRIVQEALTNVARHARVSQAIVRLRADENALHVYVEDRGIGFDPDVVEGTGLVGMRERAAALDGLLSIRASPGAGVSIAATLPLHAPA